MTASTPNAYLRTKVMTSSPAELRLMLIDGAIRFLERGKAGLESKDYEAVYDGMTRCQNIILELMNALRPEHDPDLCEKLSALYTFMYTHLVTAVTDKNLEAANEVLDLLRYERETWSLLMDRLAEQNADAANVAATMAAEDVRAARANDAAAPPEGLIGGRVSLRG